jgi:hypothetical protein
VVDILSTGTRLLPPFSASTDSKSQNLPPTRGQRGKNKKREEEGCVAKGTLFPEARYHKTQNSWRAACMRKGARSGPSPVLNACPARLCGVPQARDQHVGVGNGHEHSVERVLCAPAIVKPGCRSAVMVVECGTLPHMPIAMTRRGAMVQDSGVGREGSRRRTLAMGWARIQGSVV